MSADHFVDATWLHRYDEIPLVIRLITPDEVAVLGSRRIVDCPIDEDPSFPPPEPVI